MSIIPRIPIPQDLTPQERRRRYVIGGLMIAILVLALVLLQNAFDNGDRRRALEAVAGWQPVANGPLVRDLLLAKNGGAVPACDQKIESSFRGMMHVECEVGGDRQPFAFEVDLVRRAVTAADASTRERLEAAARAAIPAPAAAPDGGSPATIDGGARPPAR